MFTVYIITIYIHFSLIYLQYESLKILKYIVRITIYYDVIICYFMYTVLKWITAKTYTYLKFKYIKCEHINTY